MRKQKVEREMWFTMRVSAEERAFIDRLAAVSERSACDAVRRLIREAAQNAERVPQQRAREQA